MNVRRCLRCALALQMIWLMIGCCSDYQIILFEWTGLEAVHLDNTGLAPAESSAPGIPAAAYGIRAKLARIDSPASRTSLFPTASACEGVYQDVNRDTLLAMQIHAITTDTGDQPREVTDDFRVLLYPQPNLSDRIITLPRMTEKLSREWSTMPDHIDFIRTEHMLPSPGIRFIVTMQFTGGKTLADTTAAIALI